MLVQLAYTLTALRSNPNNPSEVRLSSPEIRIQRIDQHMEGPLLVQPAGLTQRQDTLDPAAAMITLRA